LLMWGGIEHILLFEMSKTSRQGRESEHRMEMLVMKL